MFFKNEKEYKEYLKRNGILDIDSNSEVNYFNWDSEGHMLVDIKKCKE